MADKIVSLGDVRKKLYYIFRSYDIPKCVRNDVFGALKKIPEVKAVPERCLHCEKKITKE